MTRIQHDSPVRRVTEAKAQGLHLVVALGTHTMKIRQLGRRFAYEVSYEQVFYLGARNAAAAAAAEKAATRTARRAR